MWGWNWRRRANWLAAKAELDSRALSVTKFWRDAGEDAWFEKNEAFDADFRNRFLDLHYASGLFVASGRRVPRSGGVILVSGEDRARAVAALEQDPFYRHGVATFELLEFSPSRMRAGFEAFV